MGGSQSRDFYEIPHLGVYASVTDGNLLFYVTKESIVFSYYTMLVRRKKVLRSTMLKLIDDLREVKENETSLIINNSELKIRITRDVSDSVLRDSTLYAVKEDVITDFMFMADASHKLFVLRYLLNEHDGEPLEQFLERGTKCFNLGDVVKSLAEEKDKHIAEVTENTPVGESVRSIHNTASKSMFRAVNNVLDTFNTNPMNTIEITSTAFKIATESIFVEETTEMGNEEEEEEFVVLKVKKSVYERLKNHFT